MCFRLEVKERKAIPCAVFTPHLFSLTWELSPLPSPRKAIVKPIWTDPGGPFPASCQAVTLCAADPLCPDMERNGSHWIWQEGDGVYHFSSSLGRIFGKKKKTVRVCKYSLCNRAEVEINVQISEPWLVLITLLEASTQLWKWVRKTNTPQDPFFHIFPGSRFSCQTTSQIYNMYFIWSKYCTLN